AVFLDYYQVPPYTFEDWHLLAAIPLGLFAALLVTLMAGFTAAAAGAFERLRVPDIAKPTLGGVIFGVIGVALPLTLFNGGDQLKVVLGDAGAMSLGLLIATLVGRMLTFAVSQGSGLVGGPIVPSVFGGVTAGLVGQHVVPGVPLGQAFACLLAADPEALAEA